jgi:hypothetical protein
MSRRRDPLPPEATPTEPTHFVVAQDAEGRWCVRISLGWVLLELPDGRAPATVEEVVRALDLFSWIGWGCAPGSRCIRAARRLPETVAADPKRIDDACTIDALVRPPAGIVSYLTRRRRDRGREGLLA